MPQYPCVSSPGETRVQSRSFNLAVKGKVKEQFKGDF